MSFSIKDLFKDVTYTVNERIKNPLWLSFLILLFYWNWESFFRVTHIISHYKDLNEAIVEIKRLDYHFWAPLGLAFGGVVLFYVVQYLSLIISIYFQDNLKPNLIRLISSKRIATRKRVDDLIQLLDARDREISDLRNQLSDNKKYYTNLIDELNNSNEEDQGFLANENGLEISSNNEISEIHDESWSVFKNENWGEIYENFQMIDFGEFTRIYEIQKGHQYLLFDIDDLHTLKVNKNGFNWIDENKDAIRDFMITYDIRSELFKDIEILIHFFFKFQSKKIPDFSSDNLNINSANIDTSIDILIEQIEDFLNLTLDESIPIKVAKFSKSIYSKPLDSVPNRYDENLQFKEEYVPYALFHHAILRILSRETVSLLKIFIDSHFDKKHNFIFERVKYSRISKIGLHDTLYGVTQESS